MSLLTTDLRWMPQFFFDYKYYVNYNGGSRKNGNAAK